MRRLIPLLGLAVLWAPSMAGAKPIDPDQTFTGTVRASIADPDWHLIPGTRAHFVAPGKYGGVDLVFDYRMTGQCGGCEIAVFQDGSPVVGTEDALDGEGLSFAAVGNHRLQLAVRGTAEVDGPWSLRVQQVR